MEIPQTVLLINGSSRQSQIAYNQVLASLKSHHFDITTIYEVDDQNSLAQRCAEIICDKPSLVIIGGGDGTVSSALHFFADSQFEIGIIPLGTTNNFARSLGLPNSIDAAVNTIKRCKAHPVDLGIVNSQHFANVVGIGLSTTIARKVTDKTKKRYGRFAYLLIGMKQLFKHRAFTVTVSDAKGQLSSA